MLLWRGTGSALYKTLAAAWGSGILTLGIQAMAVGKQDFYMALAYTPSVLYTVSMASVMAQLAGGRSHGKASILLMALALILSGLAHSFGQPSWVIAFPISLAVAFPVLYAGANAFYRAGKRMTTVQKGLSGCTSWTSPGATPSRTSPRGASRSPS